MVRIFGCKYRLNFLDNFDLTFNQLAVEIKHFQHLLPCLVVVMLFCKFLIKFEPDSVGFDVQSGIEAVGVFSPQAFDAFHAVRGIVHVDAFGKLVYPLPDNIDGSAVGEDAPIALHLGILGC